MRPGGLPEYSIPLVGFAQWHLARGESQADTLERISADPRYAGIDPEVIALSIEQAQRNVDATQRLDDAGGGFTMGEAYLRFGGAPQTVGARVVVVITLPDGHQEQGSVTVNARDASTIKQVLDTAVQFVESGGLTQRAGRNYTGIVEVAYIAQLIEGGIDNPAAVA